LTEMLTTDGLLILQASNCNHQIPAKLYEYMRAGRPILALTDPVGDTAKLLQEAGIHTIAPLDDVEAIQEKLLDFLTAVQQGRGNSASLDYVARC
ncbi:MAG: glycosyltransferase, partial [Burkholderiales bacterium]